MIEQGTDAWRLARCGFVTASKLDAVLAKGRGNAPSVTREDYLHEKVCEILTGVPAEDGFQSWDMKRGQEIEPDAALAYEIETGVALERCGFFKHPRIARVGASPDRRAGVGLAEIKCPKTKNHLAWMRAGKPPPEYIPQMTLECVCAQAPWCDFVSYDPRLPEDLQLFIVRFLPVPEYVFNVENEIECFLRELDQRLAEIGALRGAA